MAEKKSILEQLLEEAMAKGAEQAQSEDFAVNLRADDGSSIEGIPLSKVGKDFLAKFGITSGEGDGDGGEGDGDGGGTQPGTAARGVKDLFAGGKRPAGGKTA